MKKVTTIELVNTITNESLGYAPVIEERGQKSIMIMDSDGKPVVFPTRKDAKNYGVEYIKVKEELN